MFEAYEINFESYDGSRLSGELVVPSEWTGVLVNLQQGSVLCDRDGQTPRTDAPSTLYRRIARLLAEAGIASFRHDKRQWDRPAPEPLTYSFTDRVGDHCAALMAARSHPSVAGAKAVLVGHSEGGLVVQRAAAELSKRGVEVDGVVVLASPAVTLTESLEWRANQALSRGGPKLTQIGLAMHAVLHEVRRRAFGGIEFGEAEFEAYRDWYAKKGGLQGWESWAWMREHALLKLDQLVQGVSGPALYLHGDHDRIVDPASLEGYSGLWDAAGKAGAEFELFPNLGHYLEDSTRKAFVVSEPLVARVAEWVNARAG